MAEAPAVAVGRLSDRSFFLFNAVVSVVACSFIGYVLVLRDRGPAGGAELGFLPAVNASLNGLSAVLLSAGWVAIRRGAPRVHKRLMVAAFGSSTAFLVSYLVYHYAHGDTKYQGAGGLKAVYLLVLASHIALSMFVVPLALTAFYFALRGEFQRHRRVTCVALPIWLYVSATGVVIYLMLRGAAAAPG